MGKGGFLVRLLLPPSLHSALPSHSHRSRRLSVRPCRPDLHRSRLHPYSGDLRRAAYSVSTLGQNPPCALELVRPSDDVRFEPPYFQSLLVERRCLGSPALFRREKSQLLM